MRNLSTYAEPWQVWVHVCYEGMAREVRDRIMAESPETLPFVAILPDGTCFVLYRPDLMARPILDSDNS